MTKIDFTSSELNAIKLANYIQLSTIEFERRKEFLKAENQLTELVSKNYIEQGLPEFICILPADAARFIELGVIEVRSGVIEFDSNFGTVRIEVNE